MRVEASAVAALTTSKPHDVCCWAAAALPCSNRVRAGNPPDVRIRVHERSGRCPSREGSNAVGGRGGAGATPPRPQLLDTYLRGSTSAAAVYAGNEARCRSDRGGVSAAPPATASPTMGPGPTRCRFRRRLVRLPTASGQSVPLDAKSLPPGACCGAPSSKRPTPVHARPAASSRWRRVAKALCARDARRLAEKAEVAAPRLRHVVTTSRVLAARARDTG